MKCAPFEYVRVGSVEEAVAALAAADGEGKILAGGQSLVPMMALRLAHPAVLVDVNRIPDLDGVVPVRPTVHAEPPAGMHGADPPAAAVHVGALTRHRDLLAQRHHPLLAEAAGWIGHAAIRSRGTAGGSVAHADPAAELPVVAVATGAVATVAGAGGTRNVAVGDLLAGPLTTSLAEDEMVTGLRFPLPDRWGFAEFARRHGDFALVTAVVAEVAGTVRIALGGVGGVPVRAAAAEKVLGEGGTAAQAADAAAAELRPTADVHAGAPYRRALAAEMIRRALAHAGLGRDDRWT